MGSALDMSDGLGSNIALGPFLTADIAAASGNGRRADAGFVGQAASARSSDSGQVWGASNFVLAHV
jgi:hypothetical protein